VSPLASLLPLILATAAAASAARGPGDGFCDEPQTVWCEKAEELPFRALATSAAPILWFSRDEPLLRGERRRRIPQPIDCTRSLDPAEVPRSSDRATVYYQVRRALLTTDPTPVIAAAFEDERIPLDATRKLTLRFFFYYEEDFGFRPHIHDLEGMEFQVAIEAGSGEWHRARLLSTKAYAHSSDWQANILQMREDLDVLLPLTVLVEEGKHASCPDRNGDGIYTPGYDVNVRVNDAWGVRDIFRSRITGARFRSEEFKPRTKTDEGYRIGPPGEDLTSSVVEQRSRYQAKGFELPTASGSTYTLVSAHETPACPRGDLPDRVGRRGYLDIGKRMEEEGFGLKGSVLHRHGVSYRYGPNWPLTPLRNMAPSYANDGQSLVELDLYSWKELPLFGGWPFLRGARSLGKPERWVLDVGYTPSISRVIDWYVAAGARWDRVRSGWDTSFEGEAGLQVRWSVLGFRLGIRARVADFSISNERLVIEVGLGPLPGGSVRGRE
jgi:hypothetical protein